MDSQQTAPEYTGVRYPNGVPCPPAGGPRRLSGPLAPSKSLNPMQDKRVRELVTAATRPLLETITKLEARIKALEPKPAPPATPAATVPASTGTPAATSTAAKAPAGGEGVKTQPVVAIPPTLQNIINGAGDNAPLKKALTAIAKSGEPESVCLAKMKKVLAESKK